MDFRFVCFLAVLGFVQCKLLDLKCEGIKKFVEGHNVRRQQLAQGKLPGQAAAAKMNALIWDEELAVKAAEWASKEKYGHNPDRKIPSDRFGTGENIYRYGTTSSKSELDLELPIKAWWSEHKDFHYKVLEWSDFAGGPDIGHYTQMAWSNSIYLGCAVSKYQKDNWYNFFVVCNYGPAGNYIGQAPYTSGKASGGLSCGSKNCSRPYGGSC